MAKHGPDTSNEEQLTTQWALNLSMGMGGNQIFIDGVDSSGNIFYALQILSDAVITVITSTNTDATISKLIGVTINAGTVLYGEFSAITITSGLICGYIK